MGVVWSLCCEAGGRLAVAGGDGGAVAAWDPRRRHAAWTAEVCLSGHGITGLALLPCGNRVAAACADGLVRVLELRMSGGTAAAVNLGAGYGLPYVLFSAKRVYLRGIEVGYLMCGFR